MTIKQLLKSKTFVFGFGLAVFGGVEIFLPTWETYFDPVMYGVLTSLTGMTVIVLRFLTTIPLDEK